MDWQSCTERRTHRLPREGWASPLEGAGAGRPLWEPLRAPPPQLELDSVRRRRGPARACLPWAGGAFSPTEKLLKPLRSVWDHTDRTRFSDGTETLLERFSA